MKLPKELEDISWMPKTCNAIRDDNGEVCGEDIENIHRMYRSMGLCEKHWCENADDSWEEFCMTREACR